MNIDFNAAFEAGMSEEDVKAMVERAMAQAKQEYEEKIAAERAAKEAAAKQVAASVEKEQLKGEARAHLINAGIAYTKAFDLLDEGEELTDEDVAKLEAELIKFEELIPMLIKLHDLGMDSEGLMGLFGL
jgi:hypothetical protein